MKFKVRGTPEEIETLAQALMKSGKAHSVEVSEVYKANAAYKNGWAWVTVAFKELVPSLSPVKIYQRKKPRLKGQKRSTVGYVYVLRAIDGSYKIGKSTNPKSRKRTFDVRLPFQVEYVHTILTDDMGKLEKALHHKFRAKRLNNSEFFKLDELEVKFIIDLGVRYDAAKCDEWSL